MSDNDKTVTSTEFEKVGQKPQEAQGVKLTKAVDISSGYAIIQRVLSELNDKSDSNKGK
jgi:hypothetical protein